MYLIFYMCCVYILIFYMRYFDILYISRYTFINVKLILTLLLIILLRIALHAMLSRKVFWFLLLHTLR